MNNKNKVIIKGKQKDLKQLMVGIIRLQLYQ